MSKVSIALLIGLTALLVTGCADRKNLSPMPSISEQAKFNLKRPVNCQTANRDIKVLEEERVSTAKQILAGVRSVFPIAAAAGILLGDYGDRVEVATGEYNHALETKIDQIKKTCHRS